MSLEEKKLNTGLGLSYFDGKKAYATIGIDSREQKPWDFNIKIPSGLLIETQSSSLSDGDYTLIGFSDPGIGPSLIIERKHSCEEFANNIGKNWARFERELECLSHFSNAYIIIEDDLHDLYAKFHNKNYKFLNLSPDFFLKRVAYIDITYGVKTIFASNRTYAQRYALNLMKYFLYQHGHVNNV